MPVHSGRWTPQDRQVSSLRYLPVDVPPGADGLRVTLDYDRTAGVLDLGCFGPAGFRGWSGGARSEFVITAAAATPGYLPGELESGTWQVAVGLHRVAAGGVPYRVEAGVGSYDVPPPPDAPPSPDRPPARDLPSDRGRWLPGDLHAHTVHSDGALTIDELAALAAGRGLAFLAVTDHNTTSHHRHLAAASQRYGLALLPGQEVTTDTGHANCFGDVGWIDFRRSSDDWLAEAEQRGGLLSINHPLAGDCAWRRPIARRPPLAEIWHSSWALWDGPLRWWRDWDASATAVGGSDWHRPGSDGLPGSPTTWVECEEGDVLGGLRAGRVSISAQPYGPLLIPAGGHLLALDAEGAWHIDGAGRRTPVRSAREVLPLTDGPHHLVSEAGAVLSLTSGTSTGTGDAGPPR